MGGGVMGGGAMGGGATAGGGTGGVTARGGAAGGGSAGGTGEEEVRSGAETVEADETRRAGASVSMLIATATA